MTHHDADLTRVFKALADPTRRAMLARLMAGPVPVTELARPTGMATPTVMRHISVLQEAALIDSAKSGRTRMCRACPGTLAAIDGWLDHQRAIWHARTDRLAALALSLPDTPTGGDKE
jgi:DNA-binding transcriptional ArsR family regulator